MSTDLIFKAELSIDPHEALKQQGFSWSATHRELAIADNGSLDILVDVKSSYHGTFDWTTTGVFHGSFGIPVIAASGFVSASLDAFNLNTFFQAANSGNFSTEISHTGSYASVAARWDFVLGASAGGGPANPIGGKVGSSLILGPGLYVFQLQNVSGAAADLGFRATWEELEIPNIPA